jgi:peptide deformylase
MTFYKILHYPHVLLRKKTSPVEKFTPELRDFLKNFIATMYKFDGGGLAAPQIGISKKIFVVDFKEAFASDKFEYSEGCFQIFDQNKKQIPLKFPLIFINPKITKTSEPVSVNWEGCLSFPNVDAHNIQRFRHVEIEGQNEFGERFFVTSFHLYASVCFLHESDHLEGVMLIDKWDKKSFKESQVLADIKDFQDDSQQRKKMKKLKVIEAHKIKFDFL